MIKPISKFLAGIVLLFLFSANAKAPNGVYFIHSTKQADSVRKALAHTDNDMLKMSAHYYLSSYYTELNKDSTEYYGILQLKPPKIKPKTLGGRCLVPGNVYRVWGRQLPGIA